MNTYLKRAITLWVIGCFLADATFWITDDIMTPGAFTFGAIFIAFGSVQFVVGVLIWFGTFLKRRMQADFNLASSLTFVTSLPLFGALLALYDPEYREFNTHMGHPWGWPFRIAARPVSQFIPFFHIPPIPATYFIAIDLWHVVLGSLLLSTLVYTLTTPSTPYIKPTAGPQL